MPDENKPDALQDVLMEARRLADEGKYEEALQKHLWYHDHALEINPGHSGVRLSFALSDWVALGRMYPKALVALRAIRDEKRAHLLAGKAARDLFEEVASISLYLGEGPSVVGLLKQLLSADPALDWDVYRIVDEALVDAGEFALARRFMRNPRGDLAMFDEILSGALEVLGQRRYADHYLDAPRRGYAADVARLLTVLDHTGDRALAEELQTKALKRLNRPEIRAALAPRAPAAG